MRESVQYNHPPAQLIYFYFYIHPLHVAAEQTFRNENAFEMFNVYIRISHTYENLKCERWRHNRLPPQRDVIFVADNTRIFSFYCMCSGLNNPLSVSRE